MIVWPHRVCMLGVATCVRISPIDDLSNMHDFIYV